MDRQFSKYLDRYGANKKWRPVLGAVGGVKNIVVIPVLAESRHLFKTLASLSLNDRCAIDKTLVLCVVNNSSAAVTPKDYIDDNRRTLDILNGIVRKNICRGRDKDIDSIGDNGLSVGYIDASSPGYELSDRDGGVGLARKIGHDASLTLFDYRGTRPNLFFSLDADTIVDRTYLATVRKYFERKRTTVAAIAFSHQKGETAAEQDGICWYETFIRYYVLGLHHARSPYGYHAIGSTIVCTADGYVSVRGMNRRKAGEDFYFLNKLAKMTDVRIINETRVYPSSRTSLRVPFGTGKSVARYGGGRSGEYPVYDPQVFQILKQWLECMRQNGEQDEKTLLMNAHNIHPSLETYLISNGFEKVWPKLKKNSNSERALAKHAMHWFDGLKTFKLIRYLSRHEFPPTAMYPSLRNLLTMMDIDWPLSKDIGAVPARKDRDALLDFLRTLSGLKDRYDRRYR